MKKSVIGILAHVDAGKTTLAEALLYKCGKIRKIGRVDTGDTHLDTHELEKERGITIFAGQANFQLGDWDITLLDTPGHVDFSAETERILQVLDYAILVINSSDGVQAHTVTLWNLLKSYNIPTIIFVTKMDFARRDKNSLLDELVSELSDSIVDFSDDNSCLFEQLAMCEENAMNEFLENEKLSDDTVANLISARLAFACFFGSGLKMQGIDEFTEKLKVILTEKIYPDTFGAKVFKISHDTNGAKVTHLKITGGKLKVRDIIKTDDKEEKISSIRIYSGAKFTTTEEMTAGGVCAVCGLSSTQNGQGLGIEKDSVSPFLEPVMNYRIGLPEKIDAKRFLPQLKLIEEEDPMLRISWNSHLQEINVSLMGEIQVEILKSIIKERFDIDVTIDNGRVLYKETIEDTVEGVGHYEPLRHYAEVHLIMTPLKRGEGLIFETKCHEDILDRNWQRLILGHLYEKQHLGVLTGSPITDIKITLAAGRAHQKHTEGGDFRQATYRAVRHGLMRAKSVLLEPYYSFRLEVPSEQIGRAISDIKQKCGKFSDPEDKGDVTILTGTAPVTELNNYAGEVSAYTSGRGRLRLTLSGYDICHNAEEVIEKFRYNPESDLDNTPDSVFCAHGAGFNVKWNQVQEYMHLESCIEKEAVPFETTTNKRNFHIDDKELEAIMEREFGPAKLTQTIYKKPSQNKEKNYEEINLDLRKKYILVDGYNCIFAWENLKKIAENDIEGARKKLADILSNYSAYTKTEIVLVFDGYKVQGNPGENINYHNIHIVYTKENELGDVYIEKMISEIGRNHNVRVVTSDNLIQLTAVKSGVLRVSAQEFEKEIKSIQKEIDEFIKKLREEKHPNVVIKK